MPITAPVAGLTFDTALVPWLAVQIVVPSKAIARGKLPGGNGYVPITTPVRGLIYDTALVPSFAVAHPGHEHKTMGTIASIEKYRGHTKGYHFYFNQAIAIALISLVTVCFAIEIVISRPDVGAVLAG